MDAVTHRAAHLDELVRLAQDELAAAIAIAGLARDPMRLVLAALSSTIGAMHGLQRAASDHEEGVRRTLAVEASVAIERATKEMQAAEAISIARIAEAVAASAEAALTRRVRVFDRNSALVAVGLLVSVAGAALGGGYAWGRAVAEASVRQTEAGLNAAFRDGAGAAGTWLALMRANDPGQMLGECAGAATWIAPDGRRACRAALWLDTPRQSAPTPAGLTTQTPMSKGPAAATKSPPKP